MNNKKSKNRTQKNFKYNSTWNDRIQKLINNKKYSQALKEINSYLEKYTKDEKMLTVLAKCFCKMGELDEAEKVVNHLIENESSEKARALFILASIASQKGDFDSEKKYYEESASLGYSVAKSHLAVLEKKNKNYKRALEIINSIDLVDYNSSIYLTKASLLFEMDSIKEALEIIENYNFKDITKNQYSFFARTKSLILMANNKYDDAIKILEDYTDNYATEIDFNHILLIERYIDSGNYQKAVSLTNDVLDCDNERLKLYARYCTAKINKNIYNKEKAKNQLLTLVSEVESKPDDRDILSRVYEDLGDLELLDRNYIKAKEYYSKINAGENKNVFFYKNMRLAIIEFRLGNIINAFKIVESVRNVMSNNLVYESRIYRQLITSLRKTEGISFTLNNYFERQLNEYNIDEAIKNCSKVHKTGAKFNENIDVSQLIYEVPNLISDSNMIYNGCIEKYRIYYESVGTVCDIPTNYMDVVTLPDSKKIIFMYPVVNTLEKELCFNEERGKAKKKTKMSQIDKFNAKYNK